MDTKTRFEELRARFASKFPDAYLKGKDMLIYFIEKEIEEEKVRARGEVIDELNKLSKDCKIISLTPVGDKLAILLEASELENVQLIPLGAIQELRGKFPW